MRLYNALPLFPFFQKIIRDRSIKKRVLFPALLSIELTNYCNARCIMCPRGKMTREKKHMDFSLFKKIILDSQNHPLKKINLFWFGEPLVYSRFLEALSFIKKTVPGVKVNISTNGGLLNRDISEKIVRENLASSINIDLDGMKKETAEKIRPGTKFEEVLGNIDSLLEMKTRYRDSTVKVSMTIIEMEENKEEISAFYAYWKKRVKQVNVNNYNTWGGNVPGSHSGTRNRKNGFDFPCEHPWNELVISADGTAGLCCLDFDCTAVVGDARAATLKEIWNGKKMNFYRNRLLELDYSNIVCEKCNAYIFQKKSFWRALWV